MKVPIYTKALLSWAPRRVFRVFFFQIFLVSSPQECGIMLHYTDTRIAKFNRRRDIYDWKAENLIDGVSLWLVCNLAFIWGNSLVSRSDSHDLSVGVLGFLPGFIRDLFPNQEQLVHIVRKMAHFTEFACLGGLSCGLLATARTVKLHPFFTCGREAFLWLPSMKHPKSLRAGAPSSRTCGWISPGSRRGCWRCCWSGPLSCAPNRRNPPKRWDNVIAFQKATMRSNTYIPPGSPELIKQKKNFGNSLENPKFFFYFS